MAKRKKKVVNETPAQRLSGIVKRCRNIMRKDKGLNGDSDRLPMLTWIMFLKFLDDHEAVLETEAKLRGQTFKSVIPAPYRWRDWARNDGFTGDDLLEFINNETAYLPDKTKGKGLFFFLRGLASEEGNRREDVLATVFKGVSNRMINGYLLRDVFVEIDKIHFTSNEEINTLSHLYESLLREMRDASGDAGEFYTPRPVVQFMVEKIDPQIGETVLDPAAGTGGFLVSSFDRLKKQAKTVQQLERLQTKSIYGGEAKPLPYLLCQMNLLLHGLEFPQIDPLNSLRHKLNELGDAQRVDVILTNPPFGGEEERGILNNFPKDKQTAETMLLFLQLIMRKLRRKTATQRGGRAAIVVPNGTLFADGVAARIKEQMLKDYNLHTIIRLAEGVFAPYTDIPANILFFEQGQPTDTIWYFEIPSPEGRKKYSKTKPMLPEEFDTLRKWWDKREETEHSWQLNFAEILEQKEAEAQPYWDKAQSAKNKADKLMEQINHHKKQLKADLSTTEESAIKKEIRLTESKLKGAEQEEKENQSQGDSIYYSAFNLDVKNPNNKSGRLHEPSADLMNSIFKIEKNRFNILSEIQSTFDLISSSLEEDLLNYRIDQLLLPKRDPMEIDPMATYKQVKVKMNHQGVELRKLTVGSEVGSSQYIANSGDFILSKIDARNGAMGIIPKELDGAIVTNDFPLFQFTDLVIPEYFDYFSSTGYFDRLCKLASEGSTNRRRIKLDRFNSIVVPLPSKEVQRKIVDLFAKIKKVKEMYQEGSGFLNKVIPSFIKEISENNSLNETDEVSA